MNLFCIIHSWCLMFSRVLQTNSCTRFLLILHWLAVQNADSSLKITGPWRAQGIPRSHEGNFYNKPSAREQQINVCWQSPPGRAALELLSISCMFLLATKLGNGAKSAQVPCQQPHRWSLLDHRLPTVCLPLTCSVAARQQWHSYGEAPAFDSG